MVKQNFTKILLESICADARVMSSAATGSTVRNSPSKVNPYIDASPSSAGDFTSKMDMAKNLAI